MLNACLTNRGGSAIEIDVTLAFTVTMCSLLPRAIFFNAASAADSVV